MLRRLRGKCREKGNAAALRLFISQRFLKTPVLSLAAPTPHFYSFAFILRPIQNQHTWMPCCYNSWAWLRQPSTVLRAKQPYGDFIDPLLQPRQEEAQCSPKYVWMLATSLCRSLQRGTSNPPKAIGLYNLLCTRLWLWKERVFFFFF